MSTKGIQDPLKPFLEDAIECVRFKTIQFEFEVRSNEGQRTIQLGRFEYALTHGRTLIHGHDYRQIFSKLTQLTEAALIDLRLKPTTQSLFEVRLSVLSPYDESAEIRGISPMIYCFVNLPEPHLPENRLLVWDFLMALREKVHARLSLWAAQHRNHSRNHENKTIRDIVTEILRNMAFFVVFTDGFMGGWSSPLSQGQCRAWDTGKPENPTAPDQTWENHPLSRAVAEW